MLTFLAFNDFAEHDIEWGEDTIAFDEQYAENWNKEYWLSRGLKFIRDIVTAKSYEE